MNVPAGYFTPERLEEERQRQAERMSWELTFMQIQAIPTTNDCPPEEQLR